MKLHWDVPALSAIEAARDRIAPVAIRTPLVRLDWDEGDQEIWLKLELCQPIRSFKLRGAYNAMAALDRSVIAD
ncbi:MAG TPA: pyridoxal-phosphate dependent enzyme, partial [Thermomicrobiales bacterium]|nr:pyridoxal-phosphate dependent enzyme [Thermomicrobiales bacterium]